VALVAFIVLEFFTSEPVVNLRLLCRRNFGLGTLGNFLVGFALYAAPYLLLPYLAVTQGIDAEQAGEVVAWTELPQLLVIPLVPLLMKRIDARLLVGAGLLVFGASCFMNLDLDLDYAAPQLFWPDVTRALGQAIILTPLSAIAMVGIAPAGQHIRFARLRIPPDPRTTALGHFDSFPPPRLNGRCPFR
jgi:MFS transporter, DHA2 family, multidrug resistance protein